MSEIEVDNPREALVFNVDLVIFRLFLNGNM